jgi:predicted neuraminidase
VSTVGKPGNWAARSVFKPTSAANTIRARKASCRPVVEARTNCSNSTRSRSLNTTFGGLGVGIVRSGQIKMPDLTRLASQSRLLSAHLYETLAARVEDFRASIARGSMTLLSSCVGLW